jgi:molecular chaperone IbpA
MTTFQRDLFFGFDELFNSLNNPQQKQSYPPYNVVRKDDNHYLIEIAVAGFKSDEIDLILEKGILTVSGKHKEYENNRNDEYVHKGISTRDFSRSFTLAETIKVVGADIVNGLLLIGLENEIPEEDKPQTINLGEFGERAKELLLG